MVKSKHKDKQIQAHPARKLPTLHLRNRSELALEGHHLIVEAVDLIFQALDVGPETILVRSLAIQVRGTFTTTML